MPEPLIPADLPPDAVVAIVDTREQQPLSLAPLRAERGTLATGDYSIKGLETVVAIERKSLADLITCVGQERGRFDREIQRLLAYPVRAVVVEATWAELELANWRGKVTASAATGSVLGWIAAGVPFLFTGTRQGASKAVTRLLFIAARRRWREARSLVADASQRRSKGKPASKQPPGDGHPVTPRANA